LGIAYDLGEGVPKDDVEAARWWRLAAEQGYADAQCSLGIAYDLGKGVPKDAVEAVKWWRLAAEQGHIASQFNLGTAHNLGKGIPKDVVEGYKWLNIAAAFGANEAGKSRDELADSMTPDQIAEAQKLSSEWKPTFKKPQ
jgi:TPR repeat protein